MTTVNNYRVYCTTEDEFINQWGLAPPTMCPRNNAHTIDSNMTSIVDTVSSTTVYIDSKSYAGTQGFYMMEGGTFAVPSGSNNSKSSTQYVFDLPSRLFGFQVFASPSNVGDTICMSINPKTVIGILTASVSASSATVTFSVSPTVLAYCAPGFFVTLTDLMTNTVHNAGKCMSVNVTAGTITCMTPCNVDLTGGATTVAITVFVTRNFPITNNEIYAFGYGTMGSKPLPAGTVCVLDYLNTSSNAKTINYAMEYTY